MSQIPDRPQYPDLYLTLNPSHESLHIKRSADGLPGFRRFVGKNADPFLDEPMVPDNRMFYYRFTPRQLGRLPELEGVKCRAYFKKLLPALRREGVVPEKILPLNTAIMLEFADRSFFDSCREVPLVPLASLLPAGHTLDLALPPFRAYTAVETKQGVLLFSPTLDGSRRLEGYMQHLADTFFDPSMPHDEVNIHQIPAFDPKLSGYADCCPKFPNGMPFLKQSDPERIVPPEAFAPKAVLKDGVELLHYDMSPTWENFDRLTMPPQRSGLHVSQRNYDISCLLRYAERGYILPAEMEHDVYSFTYAKRFEDLYRLVPEQWPSSENQVRLLAERILRTDFPDIRHGIGQQAEEMQLHIPDMTPDTQQKSKSLKPH